MCLTYPIVLSMAITEHLFKNMNCDEDDIDWSQVDWVGEIQRNRYLHDVWKEKCMEQLAIELKKHQER